MGRLLLTTLALLLAFATSAQSVKDSIPSHDFSVPPLPTLGQRCILPLASLTAGTVGRFAYPSRFDVPHPKSHDGFIKDALPFVPLAATWALKGFGVPTRSTWGQMAVSQGISITLAAASTYSLKNTIHANRPDGHGEKSWPSGHTTWAFMSATMMARELGPNSAWYPMGAYFVATGVASQRVLGKAHLPSDVLAGAGIGILATQLGYAIGDLIMGRNIADGFSLDKSNTNFSFLSVQMGLALPLGHITIPGGKLCRLPAFTAGIRAGHAVGDNWGFAVDGGFSSTPIVVEAGTERDFVGNLTAIGGTLSPYFTHAVSNRLSVYAMAGIGYYRNLRLRSLNRSVQAGNGSAVGRAMCGASFRFTDHFQARASIGYQLHHHSFTVQPSPELGITDQATRRGATSSILFQMSSTYTF